MTVGAIVDFPAVQPDAPAWVPPTVESELRRIDHWLEAAQHGLARLPGATQRHQRVLRHLADELRADALAGL